MIEVVTAVPAVAGLAQLVEHLICNQRVGGSSPSAGTSKNKGLSPASREVRCGIGPQPVKMRLIALVACVRLDYPTRASTSHTGHLFWRAEQGGRTVISYPECLLVSVEFGKTVAQFQIP